MSPERNCQMWYAIQTRTRRERSTATLLSGKGYEIFFPTYVSERRLSSRTEKVRSPLFPGYLFCRFDVHKRLPVLVTPGVIGVVAQGRVPIPVPLSEISAIQSLVSSGVPAEPCPYLECGQRVQIADHALRGLEGILVAHKGNHLVVVSVTLLRRSVALEIHRSCVIPIQPLGDAFVGSVHEGVLHAANV
jgi:transcription antitermination factor NusG